jgi:hypothetical protein
MNSRKASVIPRGELKIGEAVDQHATRAEPLDRVEQGVDPLVDLDVHRRAVEHLHGAVERPGEGTDDALELRGVLLQARDHPWLAAGRPRHHELQPHQRLADPGRSRAERRRSSPVAAADHRIELRNARPHPGIGHGVSQVVPRVSESREHVEPVSRDPIAMPSRRVRTAAELQHLQHAL